jgi:hypothetical protein
MYRVPQESKVFGSFFKKELLPFTLRESGERAWRRLLEWWRPRRMPWIAKGCEAIA